MVSIMSNNINFDLAFENPFTATDLLLTDKRIGKVRDSYCLDNRRRLFITTDRLSAFDKVLAALPYKGQVLNQLTAWWFEQTADIIPNHLISLPDPNAVVAINARPFPIEVIVRGYITGVTSTALWARYAAGEREIYGYRFKDGLLKNQALPKAIITPTTKGGPTGHDERLTCAEVVSKGYLDHTTWEYIQSVALSLFQRGQQLAPQASLLLVDTKYEFGLSEEGKILLIDEIHTPDSSRFWLADTYDQKFNAQQEPDNYDKEMVRLAYVEKGYRGEGKPPELAHSLWEELSRRYINIYERFIGSQFLPGEYPVMPRLKLNLEQAQIL